MFVLLLWSRYYSGSTIGSCTGSTADIILGVQQKDRALTSRSMHTSRVNGSNAWVHKHIIITITTIQIITTIKIASAYIVLTVCQVTC